MITIMFMSGIDDFGVREEERGHKKEYEYV